MKPGVFREEYIAIIVRELLRGLEYLHGEGKLHRDIKGLPSSSSGFLLCLQPIYSCKYFTFRWRRSKIGRFRCFRAVIRHTLSEEEYIRWNAILDVARSNKAKWL